MAFSRVLFRRVPWGSQPLGKSTRVFTLKDSVKRTGRRHYSSEGEQKGPKPWLKTDWPWAIVSLSISVPSIYLLSQPQVRRWKERSEKKRKEKAEKAAEGNKSASPDQGKDSKSGEHKEGETDSKDAASEDGIDADTSDDEKGEEDKSKSDIGQKQAEDSKSEQDSENEDDGAPSKPAGDVGNLTTQSAKGEGSSNVNERHATDLVESEHSKKGHGVPETAKIKGTVDPNSTLNN